jgi:hypothetical protein
MPTSTRLETGDRVGSFFYPANVVHVYEPPGVSKKNASHDVLPAGIVREFRLHGARGTDGNHACLVATTAT